MIARDKKNGGYRVAVPYKNEFGVTKRKWRRCKTLKDAKQIEAKLTTDIKNYNRVADSMTLDELFNEMKGDMVKKIRATTIYGYESKYRLYISPVLGALPVNDIGIKTLQKWKNSFPPKALGTKHQCYIVMSKLLRYGKKIHGFSAIDALQALGTFKGDPNKLPEEETLHFWTPAQFAMFSEALKKKCEANDCTNPSYFLYWNVYVVLNICFFAGLRRGEACALQVKDYHKEGARPYLDINKSLPALAGNCHQVAKTKNEQSIRKVPIPNTLVRILDEQIERLKRLPDKFSEDFFIAGGTNTLCVSSIRDIKIAVEDELHLEHIRVHDLRHSYVSVLINAGVPITTISKLVGHTSVEVTWKVYSHLYPDTLSNAIDIFDQIMPQKNVVKSVTKSVPLS